jgi:hypothetical protein
MVPGSSKIGYHRNNICQKLGVKNRLHVFDVPQAEWAGRGASSKCISFSPPTGPNKMFQTRIILMNLLAFGFYFNFHSYLSESTGFAKAALTAW